MNRDRGTGRYTYELERRCVCGHALAVHTAERKNGEQPCISVEFKGQECGCESYRPAKGAERKKKEAR